MISLLTHTLAMLLPTTHRIPAKEVESFKNNFFSFYTQVRGFVGNDGSAAVGFGAVIAAEPYSPLALAFIEFKQLAVITKVVDSCKDISKSKTHALHGHCESLLKLKDRLTQQQFVLAQFEVIESLSADINAVKEVLLKTSRNLGSAYSADRLITSLEVADTNLKSYKVDQRMLTNVIGELNAYIFNMKLLEVQDYPEIKESVVKHNAMALAKSTSERYRSAITKYTKSMQDLLRNLQ